MHNHDQSKPTLAVTLSFIWHDRDGSERAGEEVTASLDQDFLTVYPPGGEALILGYREIEEVSSGNHRLHLALGPQRELTLYDLGYRLDDFRRTLVGLRNQAAITDLLMHEKAHRPDYEGEYLYRDEAGRERRGSCLVRLYETAAVVIPEDGSIVRFRYSELVRCEREGYTLALENEYGEKIVLSMLGYDLDPLRDNLAAAARRLDEKVQGWLKEILPGMPGEVLVGAARLLKEGKAARRRDLKALSPRLWALLESRLAELGTGEEYSFLKKLAREERIAIGIKQGLLGELTGEYLWFLIPIYATDPERPGNAVAMEAASSRGGGRATYFFRMTGREEYRRPKTAEELDAMADRFLKQVNRAMLEVNFRREPVYLPDHRLEEPRYRKYLYSLRRLPALRELRHRFIGRIIHASPEQWRRDVESLLRFNVEAADDGARWRGERDPAGDDPETGDNWEGV